MVPRLFSDINVSQGTCSVTTCASYSGSFNNQFTANLLQNLPVKNVENRL